MFLSKKKIRGHLCRKLDAFTAHIRLSASRFNDTNAEPVCEFQYFFSAPLHGYRQLVLVKRLLMQIGLFTYSFGGVVALSSGECGLFTELWTRCRSKIMHHFLAQKMKTGSFRMTTTRAPHCGDLSLNMRSVVHWPRIQNYLCVLCHRIKVLCISLFELRIAHL